VPDSISKSGVNGTRIAHSRSKPVRWPSNFALPAAISASKLARPIITRFRSARFTATRS
jgi:hypothetical protein